MLFVHISMGHINIYRRRTKPVHSRQDSRKNCVCGNKSCFTLRTAECSNPSHTQTVQYVTAETSEEIKANCIYHSEMEKLCDKWDKGIKEGENVVGVGGSDTWVLSCNGVETFVRFGAVSMVSVWLCYRNDKNLYLTSPDFCQLLSQHSVHSVGQCLKIFIPVPFVHLLYFTCNVCVIKSNDIS